MDRLSLLLRTLLLMLLGLTLTTACDDDDDPAHTHDVLEGLSLVADTTAGGTRFEVYSEGGLIKGDNLLYFRLSRDGQALAGAQLHLHPLMHMETMEHACPVGETGELAEQPGVYSGRVMFVMPSGMMGSWTLGLHLVPDEGAEVELDLDNLTVADSPWLKNFSVIQGEVTTRYFVSVIGLQEPVVGTNPVELWVARKDGNLLWPSVDSLATTIGTLMPSMGHGSSGNVAPAFVADGRYSGVVGFNMSGDWEVSFGFESATGDSLGQVMFAFEF
jgi:hypothetical protein